MSIRYFLSEYCENLRFLDICSILWSMISSKILISSGIASSVAVDTLEITRKRVELGGSGWTSKFQLNKTNSMSIFIILSKIGRLLNIVLLLQIFYSLLSSFINNK